MPNRSLFQPFRAKNGSGVFRTLSFSSCHFRKKVEQLKRLPQAASVKLIINFTFRQKLLYRPRCPPQYFTRVDPVLKIESLYSIEIQISGVFSVSCHPLEDLYVQILFFLVFTLKRRFSLKCFTTLCQGIWIAYKDL